MPVRSFPGATQWHPHHGTPTTTSAIVVEKIGGGPASVPASGGNASVQFNVLVQTASTVPTIQYSVDGGTFANLPSGSSTTKAGATFTLPGLSAGAHTLRLKDQNGRISNDLPFVIESATLSNVPATGTVGAAITGVTCTLAGIITAYASLAIGGVESTSRVSFSSGALPQLTPSSAATYQIVVYDGPSHNAVVLAQSGNIVVSAASQGTAPSTPIGVTFPSATASVLNVSWTAVSGATTYNTRYRAAGATLAWTTGPTVTAASAALSSLAQGTSYDVQVKATNSAGTSAWSPLATGITGVTPTLTVGSGQTYTTPALAIASGTLTGSSVMNVLAGTYAPFNVPAGLDGMIIICQSPGQAIIDGQGGHTNGHDLASQKGGVHSNSAIAVDGFTIKNCGGLPFDANYTNQSGCYFETFNALGLAVVRRCYIDGCNDGIFVPSWPSNGPGINVNLLVHGCKFGSVASNGADQSGQCHDMYIQGTGLTTRGNVFASNTWGNNIKTRAATDDIADLWNVSDAGRCVDIPSGGQVSIFGGTYLQKIPPQTTNLFGYCEEDTNQGVYDVTVDSVTLDINRANTNIWVANACSTWTFVNCAVNWYQASGQASPYISNAGPGYITGLPSLAPASGQTLPTTLPALPTLWWEAQTFAPNIPAGLAVSSTPTATTGLLNLTLQAKNAGAIAAPSGSRITVGRMLQKGDVPSTTVLQVYDSNGNPLQTQQDGVGNWNFDGSASYANYSFRTNASVPAGSTFSYSLKNVSGTADNVPGTGMTAAAITGAHDIKVKVYGGDCGAGIYFVSMNDIVANFPQYVSPNYYGTNYPLGGWRVRKSGKVVTVLEWWRYLKRQSDNASHRYIKVRCYTEHEADGTWSLQALNLENTNTYGPNTNATIGDATTLPIQFSAYCELYDGNTLIKAWGGPSDPRAAVLTTPLAFNSTDSSFNPPSTSQMRYKNGFVFAPQAGSTLPPVLANGGIQASGTTKPYIVDLTYNNYDQKGRLTLDRVNSLWLLNKPATSTNEWAPNTSYGAFQQVNIDGGTLESGNAGTSGATKPTLNQLVFTEGNITWYQIRVSFSAGGGSGNINCYPILVAEAGGKSVCLPTDGNLTAGSGQTPPFWLVNDDLNYLFFKTKLLASYNPALASTALGWSGDPGQIWPCGDYLMGSFNAIETTGDGPGDPRIGWTPSIHCLSLMLPFDMLTFKVSIMNALEMAEWNFYSDDEACGAPIVVNNGPDGAGAAYAGLGRTNPNFYQHINGVTGTPTPFAYSAYGAVQHFGYGPRTDFTHCNNWWLTPFMRTGREVFLDCYIGMMATQLGCNVDPGSRNLFTSPTYYAVQMFASQPGRQRGWYHKSLSTLEYVVPSNEPTRAYLKKVLDDTATVAALWPAQVRAQSVPAADVWGFIGIFGGTDNGNYYSVYMNDYSIGSIALDAWRNDRSQWSTFAAYSAKFLLNFYTDSAGGSAYYLDDYQLNITTDGSSTVANLFSSLSAAMAGNGRTAGQPANGIGQGAGSTPYGTTANTGTIFERWACTVAMLTDAGVPGAQTAWNGLWGRLGTGFTINYNIAGAQRFAPEWGITVAQ